ncbi:MAG: Asp-tRNA(Asn)/Glu-tRNA(Gln) amidotransferase subunit GatC [Candidatus Dormibacteria bacterium]
MAEERADPSGAGSIGPVEVAKVSNLARLGLSPQELEKLAAQLQVIVAAVGKLAGADTSSVEATAQVGELHNVTRPDVPAPGLGVEEALGNSCARAAGLIRVPAIQ